MKWSENVNTEPQTLVESTCINCASFTNFNPDNRGWCQIFNHSTKTYHQMTNDCILNGAIELVDPEAELNAPHCDFKVGGSVKIINDSIIHELWTKHTVIQVKYNANRYQNLDTYLSQPEWYLQIFDTNQQKLIWVAETQICHADQSHLISTEEIF